MKLRKKSNICLLLALVMLFSGICFGSVQAYSDFLTSSVYNAYNMNQELVDDNGSCIQMSHACTQETIGVKGTSIVQQYFKNNNDRNNTVKLSSSVFNVVYIPQFLSCLSLAIHEEALDISSYECAVLEFIHNKDGKKRI